MKFDAATLVDQELVVLESMLHVQLAVAKHVCALQITTALGGVLLTGSVSALLSGPSIVCSTVLRKKCQWRHSACVRELFVHRVALVPIEDRAFSKRALALPVATRVTYCVLVLVRAKSSSAHLERDADGIARGTRAFARMAHGGGAHSLSRWCDKGSAMLDV